MNSSEIIQTSSLTCFINFKKIHDDWPFYYKTIREEVLVIVSDYPKFQACKHGDDEWRAGDEIKILKILNNISTLGILRSAISHLPECFVPGPSFRISESTWTPLCHI